MLISATQITKTKSIVILQVLLKTRRQRCDKGSTELYYLFIAADSIVDDIIFIESNVL